MSEHEPEPGPGPKPEVRITDAAWRAARERGQDSYLLLAAAPHIVADYLRQLSLDDEGWKIYEHLHALADELEGKT
jgi:hypothetical protein